MHDTCLAIIVSADPAGVTGDSDIAVHPACVAASTRQTAQEGRRMRLAVGPTSTAQMRPGDRAWRIELKR